MLQNYGMGFGLSTAPLITNGKTRSISAENPRGEVGAGGKEASNLGVGHLRDRHGGLFRRRMVLL